jgi:hypothetical protein
MPDYSPYRYLTHIMSHNHWHSMRIGEAIGCRESLKLSIIHGLDISLLCILSTSAKDLESKRYAGIKSTQVPRTYCVSQPLAYHVYWWSNRLPRIAQNHVYTHGLDISLLVSSQLPPKTFNHRDMPESSPRRYPTHIASHNHWHHMCVGEAIGIRESLKFTFIHTVSTFHYLYPLNFCQSPSIIEICRNQVHTGTPHIFCLTTTGIPCVLVKQ